MSFQVSFGARWPYPVSPLGLGTHDLLGLLLPIEARAVKLRGISAASKCLRTTTIALPIVIVLLLVIVRRVLLGLLRVPLDDLDVLWDRTIVTTIPISGIGYWDSLTSLGQNGFYVISFTLLHITCHFHVLFHFPCSTESAIRRTMIIGRS